jgi:hypothetical protein
MPCWSRLAMAAVATIAELGRASLR